MPSPVGHTIAGLCGFIVTREQVDRCQWVLLLFGSVFIANLPDLDILPGLLLGDPRAFHHHGMHSILAAVIMGLLTGTVAWYWKSNGLWWGVWGGGIYLSHVLLDLLVNDPSPPFGAQLFWPFSEGYLISPITPFSSFDYFDPALGMIRTMLTLHNLGTMLREMILMAPFVGLAWCVGRYRRGGVS